MELARISLFHTITVTLIWMTCTNREVIFDVKGKFLTDDLEGFLCCCAFYDATQTGINIFLSGLISDDFLIILLDGQWYIERSDIGILVLPIMPTISSRL
jgi:hypothetical protein